MLKFSINDRFPRLIESYIPAYSTWAILFSFPPINRTPPKKELGRLRDVLDGAGSRKRWNWRPLPYPIQLKPSLCPSLSRLFSFSPRTFPSIFLNLCLVLITARTNLPRNLSVHYHSLHIVMRFHMLHHRLPEACVIIDILLYSCNRLYSCC